MITKECFGAFLWIDGTQPSVFVSLIEVEIYLVQSSLTLHYSWIREPCWSHCQTESKESLYYMTSKVSATGPTTPWSWSDIYRFPSQAHLPVMFVSWFCFLVGNVARVCQLYKHNIITLNDAFITLLVLLPMLWWHNWMCYRTFLHDTSFIACISNPCCMRSCT